MPKGLKSAALVVFWSLSCLSFLVDLADLLRGVPVSSVQQFAAFGFAAASCAMLALKAWEDWR